MEKSERKNYILYYCYILFYITCLFSHSSSELPQFLISFSIVSLRHYYLFIYLYFLGETTVTVKEIRELQGLLNKVK